MSFTIHPHKGYLNTKFNVHTTGTTQCYKLYKVENDHHDLIREGTVYPNVPHDFTLSSPGDYSVFTDNGEDLSLYVEDGYKFGGGKYKKSFIFDEIPWCFVIMEDRTYIYNRDTKRSFVEPISPDNISVISADYVLFENYGEEEQTIFSLVTELPILTVCNIVSFNDQFIVWLETDTTEKNMCVASLQDGKLLCIDRYEIDNYQIGEIKGVIFYHFNNEVFKVSLTNYIGKELINLKCQGQIVGIVSPNIVVSYKEDYRGNVLYIYKTETGELYNTITLEGHLAEINDICLIDTDERKRALEDLDFTSVPEITSVGTYHRIYFYSCEWDLFYTNQTITLYRKGTNLVQRRLSSLLCSFETNVNIPIRNPKGEFRKFGKSILFFNDSECFTRSKLYDGSGYRECGKVYIYKGIARLYQDSKLYTLSPNGYWDGQKELDLDFSMFSTFKVFKNNEDNSYNTFGNSSLGKYAGQSTGLYDPYLKTENFYIFTEGRKIQSTNLEIIPQKLSESLAYGLSVTSEGVFIFSLEKNAFVKEQILEDVYDSNSYHNVLLSEDGKSVLYRDAENAILMDIENQNSQCFEKTSYIKHINGIRPLFDVPSSLQPRLINPITGKYIDCGKMTQYQFISPNGEYYADTRLKEYIEYYYRANEKVITEKDVEDLRMQCRFPSKEEKDSEAWQKVLNKRKELFLESFDYLNKKYPKMLKNDRRGESWIQLLSEMDLSRFIDYLVGEKGVAVIRKTENESVCAKIDLGEPLSFINYVAFSQDSTYVAIAGYRSSGGGLLLMYNLKSNKTVIHENTRRAVWNVAFSANDAFASYTSTPETFFAANEVAYSYASFDNMLISGHNFLTFSSDGKYFALSRQAYISKYDKEGNVRKEWGHRPSSVVEIRKTDSKNKELITFTDLSKSGISGTSLRESVASVSFSKDNSRLMMVGNDGVIIIRNLKLLDM